MGLTHHRRPGLAIDSRRSIALRMLDHQETPELVIGSASLVSPQLLVARYARRGIPGIPRSRRVIQTATTSGSENIRLNGLLRFQSPRSRAA